MKIRQLQLMIEDLPLWGKIALGSFFVIYSILSIYGRFNVKLGHKLFSRIPENEIRTNKTHILSYTIIPIIVTMTYFYLWITYTGAE